MNQEKLKNIIGVLFLIALMLFYTIDYDKGREYVNLNYYHSEYYNKVVAGNKDWNLQDVLDKEQEQREKLAELLMQGYFDQ